MSTASRSNPPGLPGRFTELHAAPPLVDRHSPSLQAARISAEAPPPGAMASDQVRTGRRRTQLTPPSVDV
jgi:hypothetical protein